MAVLLTIKNLRELGLTPATVQEIDDIAQSSQERIGGDWCADASEKIADHLNSKNIGASLYSGAPFSDPPFGGCKVDDTHSYVVLRKSGAIIDATISQFVGVPGKPSANQIKTATGWPHYRKFPDVAIIRIGDPYMQKMEYESHTTGYGWMQKPWWLVR